MLGSEVISADSMYIYKGLDIGTAKPIKEEMRGVTHHMIDVADFFSSFTVSDYERTALPVVKSLISRGKVPVICGGTGFFYMIFLTETGSAPRLYVKSIKRLLKYSGTNTFTVFCSAATPKPQKSCIITT